MANDSYGVKRNSQVFTNTGSTTTVSNTNVKLNGELWQLNTVTGALSAGTATITIVDADGVTVFTGNAVAASTANGKINTTPVLLSGLYTITCTYSSAQSNMTTNATLIVKTV